MSRGKWSKSDADRRSHFLGVRLTNEERERLAQVAKARNMSASNVVREGLMRLLDQERTLAPATVAK